jgi:hypothetical protein
MCKDLFTQQGQRTFHLLDLLFSHNLEAQKRMPSISERRVNRARLKTKLLNEIWQIKSIDTKGDAERLEYSQAVRDAMEERLILAEDIEDALAHAAQTGRRFLNPNDGTYLACLRKKHVTYWVRWLERDNIQHIVNAYSHRMEIHSKDEEG